MILLILLGIILAFPFVSFLIGSYVNYVFTKLWEWKETEK